MGIFAEGDGVVRNGSHLDDPVYIYAPCKCVCQGSPDVHPLLHKPPKKFRLIPYFVLYNLFYVGKMSLEDILIGE